MTGPGNRFRRRGASYVFFLGTAMLVTIIGVSALTSVRLQLEITKRSNDGTAAMLYAQSAVERALVTIYSDRAWRDNIAHDTWTASQPIGRGTLAWRLVDERNLSLKAERERGPCVRAAGGNVASPSGSTASSSSRRWKGRRPTSLSTVASRVARPAGACGTARSMSPGSPHGGAGCLLVRSRTRTDESGPYQIVTDTITNGTTYTVDLWVKLSTPPEDVSIALWLETTAGNQNIVLTAPAGPGWTRVTFQLTPTWDGTLDHADLLVATASSNQDFYLDDASMTRTTSVAGPIRGTWRREEQ